MKTKTGKLLFQRRTHNSPIKTQSGLNFVHKQKLKDSYESSIFANIQHRELISQNYGHNMHQIKQQISNQPKLKKQYNNLQICKNISVSVKQIQSVNQDLKSTYKQQAVNSLSIKQQLKKQQSMVQNLELQNYRLIQQNFIMLLHLKKHTNQYKINLLHVANQIQSLQHNQALKFIYQILRHFKDIDSQISQLNGQVTIQRKNWFLESEKNFVKQRKQKLTFQNQIYCQFHVAQHTCLIQSLPKVNNIQNSQFEQFRLNHINNLKHTQVKNFQANILPIQINGILPNDQLPSIQYRSLQTVDKIGDVKDYQNNHKRLFQSEIRQPYEIQHLDRTSIIQKIHHKVDQNSLRKDNSHKSLRKPQVIHKSLNNSNQLYRMILLQASVIQHFCDTNT